MKATTTETTDEEIYGLTQDAHARYFAHHYAETVRWDWQRGRFYVFRGHSWLEDSGGLVRSLIRESIGKRAPELVETNEGLKFLTQLGSAFVQDGILKLIKADPVIGRSRIKWNPDPYLLGVKNGVVDLRTGKLRDGRAEDLVNRQCAVAYDPKARSKEWEQFVASIMSDDAQMTDFLHRALGYSLTGMSEEHVWFLCHGEGRNGKSLLLEKCVLPVLGDYSTIVLRKVLQKQRLGEGTTGEILDLEDMRYVLASEFSGELDEDRLKTLAAGGKLGGRRAYNPNSQKFWSVSKLWVDTNHLPVVTDDSEGFWRRVRVIHFERQFTVNPEYEKARAAEKEAILAWLIAGAKKYLTDGGLGQDEIPDKVRFQVESYRAESGDQASEFSRVCVDAPKARVTASELYALYRSWALDDGYLERDLMRRRTFARRMRELRPKAAGIRDGGTIWRLAPPVKRPIWINP